VKFFGTRGAPRDDQGATECYSRPAGSRMLRTWVLLVGLSTSSCLLVQPAIIGHRTALLYDALRRPAVRMGADATVDVAVVGGGPAGYVMAALLGRSQHSVALIDPKPQGSWPNNYGAWRVEWEALAANLQMPELLDCVNTNWEVTDCFFGGSFDLPDDERLRLDRAYLQVNRIALKSMLEEKHRANGVQLLEGAVQASVIAPNLFEGGLVHDASGSTLTVTSSQGDVNVRASLVVDATGFESKMTTRESHEAGGLWKELTPGYQIAYGMCVDVEGDSIAPYAKEAMTLFDYRTDHLVGTELLADAEQRPSFVYVMPTGECDGCGASAFFEETSLVGRGERRLEFEVLKQRLIRRLEFHQIKYNASSVREEEYCYIPMGGALPEPSQRIVPFGGAANTVHPATGYQLCRMLASASDVASALSAELKAKDSFDPDAAAAAAHAALWSPANRLQRDFAVFGGEFLGSQPVEILRGFFSAFFALEMDVWGGFLAGWPGLPGNANHATFLARIKFGISIALQFPPKVAAVFVGYLAKFTVEYGPLILRSIFTPVFEIGVGPPPPDPGLRARRQRARDVYVTGDSAAKREAVLMLREGRAGEGAPRGEPSPQVELLEEAMNMEAGPSK